MFCTIAPITVVTFFVSFFGVKEIFISYSRLIVIVPDFAGLFKTALIDVHLYICTCTDVRVCARVHASSQFSSPLNLWLLIQSVH